MNGDREKAPRRSQFEALLAVYDRFNEELKKSAEPQALALARAWDEAKGKFTTGANDPNSKVTRSSLTTGLKQGLRDLPQILQGFPLQLREHLASALHQILHDEIPEFQSGEAGRLARIIKWGRLMNENEYYLVRHRLDEIEGADAHREEVAVLLRLLDNFDAGGILRS